MPKASPKANKMVYNTSALRLRRAAESRYAFGSKESAELGSTPYGIIAERLIADLGEHAAYQLILAQSGDPQKWTYTEFCRYATERSKSFHVPTLTQWHNAFPKWNDDPSFVLSLDDCKIHFSK